MTRLPLKDQVTAIVADAANKGFFHLYSANLVMNLLAFGSQLLVAKFLSANELGDLKTLQSFFGLAVIVAGFGLNTAIIKLCSEERPDAERAVIFRQNLLVALIPIVLTMFVGVAAARVGLLSPESRVNQWMPALLLALPASVITTLIMAYLQARKRINLMAMSQTLLRLGSAVVIVAATYWAGFSGYIWAAVLMSTAMVVPLAWVVREPFRAPAAERPVFSESWSIAKWSLGANLIGALNGFLDVLLLNYWTDDRTTLGYYGLATIFILGLNQVTITIQTIATPYFSQYSQSPDRFRQVLRTYQRRLIALSAGIAAVGYFAVPAVIKWVYGADFAPAGMFFRILLIRYFIWSCHALLGTALIGLGQVKYNFYSVMIALAVTLSLSAVLISSHQFVGAAVAQAIAGGVTFVVVVLMTRHVLRTHLK